MLIYTVIACALALGLNLATVLLDMNYMTSVILVMGGVSAIALFSGVRSLKSRDYLSMAIFVVGSAVATTIIEKLMIVFDVWGFSNRHAGLCGLDFWGAPVEEYVYWWMAPIIVCVSYVVAVRDRNALSSFEVPRFLSIAASTMSLKAVSDAMTKVADAGSSAYLESNGTSPESSSPSKYKRGTKFPVWIWVVAFVLVALAVAYVFFRGSWKAVLATTAVFVCVAYPNELYSLSQGYWVYNQNRMIGPWLFGVPVEEWAMYTASPAAGSMLYSSLHRVLFKEQI